MKHVHESNRSHFSSESKSLKEALERKQVKILSDLGIVKDAWIGNSDLTVGERKLRGPYGQRLVLS